MQLRKDRPYSNEYLYRHVPAVAKKNPIELMFIASFCLLIFMTIINSNKYTAGLKYVWIPSVMLLIAAVLGRKRKQPLFNLLVIALGVSAAVSTWNSAHGDANNCISLIFNCFLCVCVTSYKISENCIRKIISFYLMFCLVLSLIVIINSFIGVALYKGRASIRYLGIEKDVNYLSAFILPSMVFYLYNGLFLNKMRNIWKFVAVFAAVFFAGSRACFVTSVLSIVIIVLYYLINRRISLMKKIVWMIALSICAILLIYVMMQSSVFERTTDFSRYATNSRFTIWRYALVGYFDNPFIGSGISSGSYYSQLGTRWVTHNCYIDVLAGQGIVGAVLMVSIFLVILKVRRENRCFVSVVFLAFFTPLFFLNGYEGATFWVPIMICRIISLKAKESRNVIKEINWDR